MERTLSGLRKRSQGIMMMKISDLQLTLVILVIMLVVGMVMFPLRFNDSNETVIVRQSSYNITEKWEQMENSNYTYLVVMAQPGGRTIDKNLSEILLQNTGETGDFLVDNATNLAFLVNYSVSHAKGCIYVNEQMGQFSKQYCLHKGFPEEDEYPAHFINPLYIDMSGNITVRYNIGYMDTNIPVESQLSSVYEQEIMNRTVFGITMPGYTAIVDKETGIPITSSLDIEGLTLKTFLVATSQDIGFDIPSEPDNDEIFNLIDLTNG